MAERCSAQKSFSSGALIFNTNVGVEGNITRQHFINGSESQAQTLNNTAPASNYSVGLEYGLFNWLGIGAIGRIDNYSMQDNGTTPSTATAGAADIGGTANIHLLKTAHFDFFAGYDLGLSHLTYTTNDGVHASSTANGTWSDMHITGRIYLGRLGINLCLYAPGTTYSNFKASNTSVGTYALNYWKSSGYGASAGLQYRL